MDLRLNCLGLLPAWIVDQHVNVVLEFLLVPMGCSKLACLGILCKSSPFLRVDLSEVASRFQRWFADPLLDQIVE